MSGIVNHCLGMHAGVSFFIPKWKLRGLDLFFFIFFFSPNIFPSLLNLTAKVNTIAICGDLGGIVCDHQTKSLMMVRLKNSSLVGPYTALSNGLSALQSSMNSALICRILPY